VRVLEQMVVNQQMDTILEHIGHLALTVVKDKKKTVSDKPKRKYIKSGKYAKKTK